MSVPQIPGVKGELNERWNRTADKVSFKAVTTEPVTDEVSRAFEREFQTRYKSDVAQNLPRINFSYD